MLAMQKKYAPLIFLGFLLLLYTYVAFYKVQLFRRYPLYNPKSDVCLFNSEGALQYRFAKLVAAGKPIPSVDRALQYPEGLNVEKSLTTFMEFVTGSLFRFISPEVSFHTFLLYFVCFFSSLSILAVFFVARNFWRDDFAALFSAFFYAFAVPAFGRTIGNYLSEDFALPFLFFGFYFFFIRTPPGGYKKILFSLLWAFSIAIALISWHLSRFFLLLFVFALVLKAVFARESLGEIKEKIWYGTGFLAIFSLLNPFLRQNNFIVSFPMILCFGLSIYAVLCSKNLCTAKITLIGTMVIGLLTSFPLADSYAHIFNLFFHKLRFLGIKPDNPHLLPYEARVMWIEEFHSPDLAYIVLNFFPLLVTAALSFLFARRYRIKFDIVLVFMTVVFLVLFFLVRRNGVFLVFFLALVAGSLIQKTKSRVILGLVGLLLFLEIGQFLSVSKPTAFKTFVYKHFSSPQQTLPDLDVNPKNLFAWIRSSTEPTSVFLADFGFSANIAAYAQRPIVIHSKFETTRLRLKVKEFIFSLFSDEDQFADFCRKYGVDYFVYTSRIFLDRSNDSYSFIAGKTDIKDSDLVFTFQFYPERLKNFELVYQNSYYRVYRFKDSKKNIERYRTTVYQPIFDRKFYGTTEQLTREDINRVIGSLNLSTEYFRKSQEYNQKGFVEEAIQTLHYGLKIQPNLGGIHKQLGFLYLTVKRFDLALSELQKEIENSPFLAQGHYDLGYVYALMHNFSKARASWLKALEVDPMFFPARYNLEELDKIEKQESEPQVKFPAK